MKAYLAAALILIATPALAADCESDARAALLDNPHAMPMRQDVTTEMSGQTIRNTVLSSPDGKGRTLDENGNAVSAWDGGKFFTSSDAGKSWSLVSEQTQEQLDAQADARKANAQAAKNFECAYGVDLDGHTVNQLALTYVYNPQGHVATSTFWVDVETGFPWKVLHDFDGSAPMKITQINEPLPDLVIDPVE